MIDDKILQKIKLIVFDLDGTLLRRDNTIGEKTIGLVKQLKEIGIKFSLASGRLHSAMIEHAETLKLETPLISLDGSLIKSRIGDEVIFESYVPEKHVNRAVSLAEDLPLKIALCHDKAIYYREFDSSIPEMLDKFGAEYKKVKSYENLKGTTLEIVITSDHHDLLKQAYKKFSFPRTFGLSTSLYKSHGKEEIYYLEIRKKGSSKGDGLIRLAKHLNIATKDAAVMGDWYNDRSLFETDALKVAVANAVPELKRMSDFITKHTNDEEAAADFLELVLQSKKK